MMASPEVQVVAGHPGREQGHRAGTHRDADEPRGTAASGGARHAQRPHRDLRPSVERRSSRRNLATSQPAQPRAQAPQPPQRRATPRGRCPSWPRRCCRSRRGCRPRRAGGAGSAPRAGWWPRRGREQHEPGAQSGRTRARRGSRRGRRSGTWAARLPSRGRRVGNGACKAVRARRQMRPIVAQRPDVPYGRPPARDPT